MLQKRKIKTKLLIIAAISVLSTCVIGFYLLFALVEVDKAYSAGITAKTQQLDEISLVSDIFYSMNINAKEIAFIQTEAELAGLKTENAELLTEANRLIADSRESLQKDNNSAYLTLLEQIDKNINGYAAAIDKVFAGGTGQEVISLDNMFKAVGVQYGENLTDDIDNLYYSIQNSLYTLSEVTAAAAGRYIITAWIIVGVVAAIFAIAVWRILKSFTRPISVLLKTAKAISAGDLSVKASIQTEEEFGALGQAFDEMADAFRQQADVLQDIAKGDYTGDIPVRSGKDNVNVAIKMLIETNNKTFTEINHTSEQVENISNQVAIGAQSISQGSVEQSANIAELSQSISWVLRQTEENAANAVESQEAVEDVGSLMNESTGYMQQMQEAMHSINESSENIVRVIKVIEDLAFQTNILALNAAVEAAHAGQHGKGFAVVADEVRTLASKSAEAAKETSGLIQSSVQRVEEGNNIAKKTSESIDKVAKSTAVTCGKIQEINSATQRQKEAIGQINAGIEQISSVVQANSAASEEYAALSEEMNRQAKILAGTVSEFRLKPQEAQAVSYALPVLIHNEQGIHADS